MTARVYRDDLRGTHYLWRVWLVRIAVLVLAILLLILAQGCASCPPCAPGQTIVDNPIPVYSCPEPPAFTPFALLSWPVLPADPTPDQIKAWYVDVVRVNDLQLSGCMASLATCTAYLDAYRATP
jgi:hypothetical protein